MKESAQTTLVMIIYFTYINTLIIEKFFSLISFAIVLSANNFLNEETFFLIYGIVIHFHEMSFSKVL